MAHLFNQTVVSEEPGRCPLGVDQTGSPEGVGEERVAAQAEEPGQMDIEGHFWNLQGIGLLGGEV